MNYNIIMLGTDLESIQNISTTLIDSTKLNKTISIFDIRKKYNNTKISTEYFSKSLFYEEIENSTDTNNIIIPDDILNFNINYIHDYIYFLPRTKFYLCIVKDSYPDYTNNFKKEMIYKRKYRIPKELTQQIVVDAVTYRSKIDNLLC